MDETKRRLHARLHSAGHAIDVAVTRSGYAEYLKPTKGYHFAEGPYVEYQGMLPADKTASFVDDLNHQLQILVEEGIDTQVCSYVALMRLKEGEEASRFSSWS